MYIRPDGRRRVSVPQNYSGSLFSEDPPLESEAEETISEEPTDTEALPVSNHKKDLFSGFFESEELIILGLILLLSQDGFGDDIIPILLIILLFKK